MRILAIIFLVCLQPSIGFSSERVSKVCIGNLWTETLNYNYEEKKEDTIGIIEGMIFVWGDKKENWHELSHTAHFSTDIAREFPELEAKLYLAALHKENRQPDSCIPHCPVDNPSRNDARYTQCSRSYLDVQICLYNVEYEWVGSQIYLTKINSDKGEVKQFWKRVSKASDFRGTHGDWHSYYRRTYKLWK